MEDRVPPQDLGIERTILGSLLIDKRSCSIAFELLSPESFYLPANAKIYETMKQLFIRDVPIDLISVAEELKKKGQFEEIGAESYLGELAESIATSANIEYYSGILIEKQLRREIINLCFNTSTACFEDSEVSAVNISSNLISRLLRAGNDGKRTIKRYSDMVQPEFDRIEKICRGDQVADIVTGFQTIDSRVFIQKNDLIVVAGRPSNGKSSFAGCVARNLGRQGKTGLCFNLESSNENEFSRALFSEARVDLNQFNLGMIPKRDLPKLSSAAGQLNEMGIYLDDSPEITPSRVYAKALKIKYETGSLDFIIIDYLQLMSADENYRDTRERINAILKVLKTLPKRIGCPIFLLSQISRYSDEKTKAPTLSNLKESGAIEEAADKVFILYTPGFYSTEADRTLMEFHIAKHKNGRIGMRRMNFQREYFLITDRVEDGYHGEPSAFQTGGEF